ncbi:S8 family serine peptidase [Paenibacillus sediminis]|uniref:Minor extracellular serine protease Vpr n=1 Tax=Paenibacillus sediminis TaxID=664909 RepID=A0ABS4H0B0_9BACL|nr:S8 family serine peptidase [Paenibacillus sediminis]MBP1935970.1 minor extracellular serine protease Vpr [Paenibacillus sediminis]
MKNQTRIIRRYFSFLLSVILTLGIISPNLANADPSSSDTAQIKVTSKLTPPHDAKLKLDTLQIPQKPQNFVESTNNDQPITVIVELASDPLKVFEAKSLSSKSSSITSHSNTLRLEHSTFQSAAYNKLGATFKREYSKVFNGYSVTLPANQVDQLLTLPGVKAVYPNVEYHTLPVDDSTAFKPYMDESAPFIGANKMWDLGYKGEGIKVGVIDTGVDYNHPSLKGAYKGGYDFVDNDTDPMETLPDPTKPIKDGTTYETTHGTHVSGTIVGQGDPDHPNDGKGWVRGIAPAADLYVYRVLGPYGSGTSEDVIAGIEKAVSDGLDVINLSLGSDLNNQYTADSIAADNASLAGVTVVLANGNAGPAAKTVGSPGAAQLAISVGASTPPLHTPIFKKENMGTIYAQIATYSPTLGETDQDLDLVYAYLGQKDDYKGLDVKDKTVLVSRGSISFGEKAKNATDAGAKALIIYNNVPGEIAATLGAPGNYVPTYTITQADGLALKDAIEKEDTSLTFSIIQEQDRLADFSSRGPALPNFTIKPDITAPGVAIRSSIPSYDGNYDNAYEDSQGTSMAAPHITGAVALMLEETKHEGLKLNPDQLKSLLTNNAVPIKNRQDQFYTVNEQGSGRVDLLNSSEAKAIVKVREQLPSQINDRTNDEYYTGSISFGQQFAGNTVSKQLTIDNISNTAQIYNVNVAWYTNNGLSLQPSQDNVYLLQDKQSTPFSVALNIPPGISDGVYDGQLVLTEASSGHQLHVPFSVFVGDSQSLSPMSDLDMSSTVFSPNGDGVSDTTDVAFAVNKPLSNFTFYVFDGVTGEPIGSTYDSSSVSPVHQPNYYQFNWNGTVDTPNGQVKLTSGIYAIVPYILDSDELLVDEAFFFLVDLEAPEFSLDSDRVIVDPNNPSQGKISGEITDDLQLQYINSDINDLVTVTAMVQSAQGIEQVDGTIDPNGHFNIDVPVEIGTNTYYLFVYDSVGNGLLTPAKVINQQVVNNQVYLSASKLEVKPKEPFDVNVNFSVTDAVYSASFSLQYDSKITMNNISPTVQQDVYQDPSVQQAVYQEPGGFIYTIEDLPSGQKRLNIELKLTDGAYNGSLAHMNFSASEENNYPFTLSNVKLYNKEDEEISVQASEPLSIKVYKAIEPDPGTDPGNGTDPGSGTNPGTNPGTGSSPSTGSVSTPPTPVGNKYKAGTLTDSTVNGQHNAVLTIDSMYISEQLKNADVKLINMDISDISLDSYHQTEIRIESQLAQLLQKSNKDLLLIGSSFKVLIPAKGLVDFVTKDGGITLSLSLTSPDKSGTISTPVGGTGKFVATALTLKGGKNDLSTPITITLTLYNANFIDRHKVGVFNLIESGQWSYFKAGNYTDDKAVQFTSSRLGSFTASEIAKSFTDTINHWANNEIGVISAHYLVTGKDSIQTFKPNDQVNQAEFLTMLDRLLGTGKTWAERVAEPGARNMLTREQAAVLLAQALNAKLSETAPQFTFKDQSEISNEARSAVSFSVSKGYFQGTNINRFNPLGTLTRAQAAVILYRVLQDLQS